MPEEAETNCGWKKYDANPAMASSIHAFMQDMGKKMLPGYVIHSGDVEMPLGDNVTALLFMKL